jgi:ATP-binding cassette subfamily B protein
MEGCTKKKKYKNNERRVIQMRKMAKYFSKAEIVQVVICLILVLFQVYLDLKLPDYMSEITTLVETPGSELSEVLHAGMRMLLCAFGSGLSAVVVGFFAARVACSYSAHVRGLIFEKVESFSMSELSNFSTASLITRATNDVQQIQMLVAMGLQMLMKAPITAVWAIVKISGKEWQWSAATGGVVAFLVIMIAFVMTTTTPRFKRIQFMTDDLNRVMREQLTGLRVVRAYNAEGYQEERFAEANGILTDTHIFVSRIMAVMNPTMTIVMSALSLLIYWIGAFIINAADMTDRLGIFSEMVVFSAYAVQIVMAFMMLSMIFMQMPRVLVCVNRINEVLDTEAVIKDGAGVEKTQETGTVEFKDVSFRYPGASDNILEHISFTAKKGQTVALIGSTGSGKSTIIKMIPRFYDATEGEILVDGINVKEYTQKQLHDKIGYVAQKATMFQGNVASNVAYGCEEETQDMELVQKAVRIAQGTEFVEKMPKTYKSAISQSGANVSGGQKQRLSIARAIYRQPEIYIFDDSFSALDYKTDRILRKALSDETKDATRIIVAQRIGTIRDADKILVIDEGQIVGEGTHDELMQTCEVYQAIAYSQLSKEELA